MKGKQLKEVSTYMFLYKNHFVKHTYLLTTDALQSSAMDRTKNDIGDENYVTKLITKNIDRNTLQLDKHSDKNCKYNADIFV